MRGLEKIPKSIVAGINRVQSSMEAVKKTQRNQHGGYQFASTDDMYASLTRLMGTTGLACLALEQQCEIARIEKDGKTVQWLHAVYQFVLATEEDTWTDETCKRTVYTQITGPQSFQAAQSYCEKSFLRSLFKIPTGDMDLDAMAQAETEEGQMVVNGNVGKRKSSYAAKKDGTTEKFNEVRKQITDAKTAEMLEQIPDLYAEEIASFPRAWNELIQNEYEDRMAALRS